MHFLFGVECDSLFVFRLHSQTFRLDLILIMFGTHSQAFSLGSQAFFLNSFTDLPLLFRVLFCFVLFCLPNLKYMTVTLMNIYRQVRLLH